MGMSDNAGYARRQGPSLVEAARGVLDGHSHFRGRVDRFAFDEVDGVLIIEGTVPSFYLKQVLQTLLREIEGVVRVINRVDVVCGNGLSGCSQETRERCALEYAWLGRRPECFRTCHGTPGDPDELAPQFVHACAAQG
jgi:hypothetical protein